MGGDKAPGPVIKGVLDATAESDVVIALVGTKDSLAQYQQASRTGPANRPGKVIPYEATQVVGMEESPADAYRMKKDSTIAVGIELVRDGKADAFVSAGNSGAIAAASLFVLRTMEGVERPAIATLYHNRAGTFSMVLDIGANVDCRPSFLLEFGQMGSDFMARVMGVRSPKVALLSNGEEDSKGTKLVKDAHKLLKESNLNFIGNVEGFDFFNGKADVIVTDGFTGNIVLKLAEALTTTVFNSLKDELMGNLPANATKVFWGPPMKKVAKDWYQSNVGGAPLLGVRGTVIISHGRAEAAEIKGSIGLARQMVRQGWASASPQPASTVKS